MSEKAKMYDVKITDVYQAVLNWQNTVGAEYNGQLETFLGLGLGEVYLNLGSHRHVFVTEEVANRIQTLLSDNHKTMIKTWMARNG